MVQLPEPESSGSVLSTFYAGKNIFITGGSGFMGLVLVERLLSTCPDIGRLYLLLREKKGVSPEKRLQHLKQSQVFNVLRAKNPTQLDKIVVLPGDVTRPLLGLTSSSRAQLRDVSLVFHSAATVKMQEELTQSVAHNLRSVLYMMELCDTLPNIQAFVHVSTAYSNSELAVIEEKVYPPPVDLEKLLELVENQELSEEDKRKLTASKPNTYTFTKAMAEHAVQRHCRRYPAAIFRPTIVISSQSNPFPGWITNLNGPSGVIAGAAAGLLHVFQAAPGVRADLMPVDIAIDTLIAVAWETAEDKLPYVKVYNCTSYENPTTYGALRRIINQSLTDQPPSNALMYPYIMAVENRYAYKILETVLQTIPLHLMHYCARLVCIKPRQNLIKANERLRAMNEALVFFSTKEWKIKKGNSVKLRQRLAEEKAFNLDPNSINWDVLLTDLVKGTRKYVLKEQDRQLSNTKATVKKLDFIYTTLKLLTTMFLIRIFVNLTSLHSLLKEVMAFINYNRLL